MKKTGLLVYIAGYGRSGSTVLDLALSGVCEEAISCGELGALPGSLSNPRLGCSCGKSYLDCAEWSKVLETAVGAASEGWLEQVVKQDGVIGFFRTPSNAYLDFWKEVFCKRANLGIEDRKRWVIVDSTKTAFYQASRPKNLSSLPGVEVALVHVKRPVLGVLKARRKGTNHELFGHRESFSGLRSAARCLWWLVVPVHWIAANTFAVLCRRKAACTIQVGFEEIRDNPEAVAIKVWREIERETGISLTIKPTETGWVRPSHMVEGNRLVKSNIGVRIRGEGL